MRRRVWPRSTSVSLESAIPSESRVPLPVRPETGGPSSRSFRKSSITRWRASDSTDALVLQAGRVADSIFDVLRKELTDEEILEFSYVIGTYAMHATLSRALRLEYDDVDERVVEIPARDARG